ncbi:hypothetical protein HGA88_04280 [Candidatus Roizmanbacteria bacterium]|nr:hypothetical protein [Candidatus Roizmanbacteria bacterium]
MQRPMKQTKSTTVTRQDTPERLNDLRGVGSALVNGTGQAFEDIGTGIFEQLFNLPSADDGTFLPRREQKQEQTIENKPPAVNKMVNKIDIFSFRETSEKQQIEQYLQQIRELTTTIKKSGNAPMDQMRDIEKMTLENWTDKPGVYHIRFLEIIISLLKLINKKISNSNTWLDAMVSKKQKRGSAFLSRSKKMGTSYFLSEELKLTRNTG